MGSKKLVDVKAMKSATIIRERFNEALIQKRLKKTS
jgi:hypothetical protein